jgi:hypothetical protein
MGAETCSRNPCSAVGCIVCSMEQRLEAPLSLVESTNFEQKKVILQPDVKKLDAALEGVTFAIARRPDKFPKDKTTGIQIAKTRNVPDNPPLTIYFKVNETVIDLLDIEITVPESDN